MKSQFGERIRELRKKQYDRIWPPIFCSDGKRVAYSAQSGDKWVAVVDRNEGKKYDGIFGNIIFDNPSRIHYIALSGNNIYLVEENLKPL